MNTSTLFSSTRDDWGTPRELFEVCDREVGRFDIDAAALSTNSMIGPYIGPDHEDPNYRDALAIDWNTRRDVTANVWLNPPYSMIRKFMAKALEQSARGCEVWVLVPARTDTRWWWDYALKASEIRFLPGRLKFVIPGKASSSAPFPSALLIYQPIVRKSFWPAVSWWRWKEELNCEEKAA